ncbi:hypothetical protein Lal_00019666 [Lupinus albus]|nr:hypothetical protein Lal_00019666 [Lupinus albus]
MVSIRSKARNMDNWMQDKEELRLEREEMRTRLELNKARTKKTKDLVAAIAMKLRVSRDEESSENQVDMNNPQPNLNQDIW